MHHLNRIPARAPRTKPLPVLRRMEKLNGFAEMVGGLCQGFYVLDTCKGNRTQERFSGGIHERVGIVCSARVRLPAIGENHLHRDRDLRTVSRQRKPSFEEPVSPAVAHGSTHALRRLALQETREGRYGGGIRRDSFSGAKPRVPGCKGVHDFCRSCLAGRGSPLDASLEAYFQSA